MDHMTLPGLTKPKLYSQLNAEAQDQSMQVEAMNDALVRRQKKSGMFQDSILKAF